MALLAMNAHRLRTFLTMLGIIIGIASVVSMVALGDGSPRRCSWQRSAPSAPTPSTIFPGNGLGDTRSGAHSHAGARRRRRAGAAELCRQRHARRVSARSRCAIGNIEASTTVIGRRRAVLSGSRASRSRRAAPSTRRSVQPARAGGGDRRQHRARQLFPSTPNPVGQVILLGSVPVADHRRGRQAARAGLRQQRDTCTCACPTPPYGAHARQPELSAQHHRAAGATTRPSAAAEQGDQPAARRSATAARPTSS